MALFVPMEGTISDYSEVLKDLAAYAQVRVYLSVDNEEESTVRLLSSTGINLMVELLGGRELIDSPENADH